MANFDIKSMKRCAFCKYWYDPTYSAVMPVSPKTNLWSIDSKQQKICTKKNIKMAADAKCSLFQNRLQDYIN